MLHLSSNFSNISRYSFNKSQDFQYQENMTDNYICCSSVWVLISPMSHSTNLILNEIDFFVVCGFQLWQKALREAAKPFSPFFFSFIPGE